MLYNLLYPLHATFSGLNIFRYLTFRASMAALTAFVVTLIIGPPVIRALKRLKIGENIRTPEESARLYELHSGKQNTPTMGGVMILMAILLATILWADLTNFYVHLALLSTVWLGVTGFVDDYLKQVKKHSKGLTAGAKFTSQVVLGLILGIILYIYPENRTRLDVPFLKDVSINLGLVYILFVVLVITGTSNAVNLTDGLDGLAIGIVVMVAIAFSVLSYVTGNMKFSEYLLIPFVKGTGELTVFCAAVFGAGMGFLWFNCYPASIFMGDVGSLALGGALGTVALLIRKELLLVIVGGIFVVEAASVILQVGSYKIRKKRIFSCAPLHHHFQFRGLPENKIITRFWIIASLLALLTIVTLKIR